MLFLLRRINKYASANKNAILKKIVKQLSKINPYVGITLLISAYIHGDLALGTIFQIHTGPLIWWVLLLMMLLGTLGKKYRVKHWRKMHQILAILFVVSVFVHLFARNIF
jgi:hypothetical protein